MCVCVCFRVKGCVTVSVDRCKAPLIGWSPLVTPQAANVQMVHCRGGDSIRCWEKLWDSSDMRLSLQDTSESNHSRMWMRPACIMHRFVSVSSLSFFFFFFFILIISVQWELRDVTQPVRAKAVADVQNSWTATLHHHKEWDFFHYTMLVT